MEALHDVVKAGKARYICASFIYAWQASKPEYSDKAIAVLELTLSDEEKITLGSPYVPHRIAGQS